jgi:hypothetical protein
MEKMVNCKACGKDIAKGVKKCPHCGKDQRNFFMKHKIITIIGVLILIGIISSIGGNKDTNKSTTESVNPTESAKEPIVLTSDDLIKALDDNALKASQTYKGQYVEVKGKLSNIDSSGDYFSIGSLSDDFSLTLIMCYISEEHLDTVMNFKDGQEVTVIGTITDVGEVMGYSIEVESIK